MTVSTAERNRRLVISVDIFSVIPALFFLLHEIFALSISYFYTVTSSDLLNQLIVYTYRARDICFIIALVFVLVKRKLTWDSAVVAIAIFFAYVATSLLYPENRQYIEDIRPYLILGVECYIIVRSRLVSWDLLQKSSVWVARFLVVFVGLGLISVPYRPQYLSLNYMTFSNAMLVPTAITIYSLYKSKGIYRIIDFMLSMIGIGMILIFGSRGAFVLLAAYAIIILFMNTEKTKLLIIGFIVLLIVLLLLGTLSSENVLLSIAGGQQSRTIEKILSGELFVSNRNNIYAYLIKQSFEDGLIGHGMCADRYYLPFQFIRGDANYAHNYYIEMLVDFGLLGVILSIAVTSLVIKRCIRIQKSSYKAYILSFFFTSFVQLLVSRSWLTEANFFIFIGLLMTFKKGIEDRNEESISTNSDIS